MPFLVREQRAMQRRMVRYLVECGVRQFLDLDSGVPTRGHVHEVIRSLEAVARVVYVDPDPNIVRDGRSVLDGVAHTVYLHADPRRPERVLEHPELRRIIDLDRPVAIMMMDTLMYVPDQDNSAALIKAYTNAVGSGSYLGISQFGRSQDLIDGLDLFSQMYGDPPRFPMREPGQLAQLLSGLDLVDPGIVPLPLWHPAAGEEAGPHAERVRVYAALGRRP
jgi:S-adenosyl methyltransferase